MGISVEQQRSLGILRCCGLCNQQYGTSVKLDWYSYSHIAYLWKAKYTILSENKYNVVQAIKRKLQGERSVRPYRIYATA